MIINKYVKTYSLITNWFSFIFEFESRSCKDILSYRKHLDDFHYVGFTDDNKCVYSDQEIYSPLLRKFIEEF